MKSIFEQAGMKNDHFSFIFEKENLSDLDIDFLQKALDWIYSIYVLEYHQVLNIKQLLSDEIWKRYQTWGGFEEHRECVLLRKSLGDFKHMITHPERPDFFKKGKLDAKLKSAKQESKVSKSGGEKNQRSHRKSRKHADKEQPDSR
jgi:hypothetical protein